MVAKFKSYFDSSEDTIIKMKYKLGNWEDVFGYLVVGKEREYDNIFESKMKMEAKNFGSFYDKDYVNKWVKSKNEEGAIGRVSNIIEPLCGTFVSVGENNRYKWQEALNSVKNRIDFLDGAKYIGMPEIVIKDLKDAGYFNYEIYIKARDTWVKGGSYTDKTTGVITKVKARIEIRKDSETNKNGSDNPFINQFSNNNAQIIYRSKVVDIGNVTSTDPVDYMVIRELKIPDDMVDKCKQNGISDIVSIAKLNTWGITDGDDIKEFKNLTEKYPVTIDELYKIRMDYISWNQVVVYLFIKYK
jgi:hypothetical protein